MMRAQPGGGRNLIQIGANGSPMLLHSDEKCWTLGSYLAAWVLQRRIKLKHQLRKVPRLLLRQD